MVWTLQEAQYALDQLIARRKIRPTDVTKALKDRKKEIDTLRRKLAELESLDRPRRATTGASARRPPKRRLSARVRAQRRLQGRYMGYVRRLTAAQKNQVRKVRKEKGWQAAIRMAAGLAKAPLGARG